MLPLLLALLTLPLSPWGEVPRSGGEGGFRLSAPPSPGLRPTSPQGEREDTSGGAQAGHAQQTRYAMGTLWTVEADGPDAPGAIEAAFAEIRRLESLWTTYQPDSEISRLNRDGARGWVPLSPETHALLARSLAYARETEGAFDPTVGPLVDLWGFKHLDYRIPSEAEIRQARARVGHRAVQLDPANGARFTRPGMSLDLGAIAKGTAVDAAIALLQARGMRAGRVDAAGNQRVFGAPAAIGIKHPRDPGGLLGGLRLDAAAIATAGDAERGFWRDGVRYGHILDPRTGKPARGLLSVTVVAPTAEEADALDTPLYVMGVERGLAWLKRHPNAHALFVAAGDRPGTYRTVASPGFAWVSAE